MAPWRTSAEADDEAVRLEEFGDHVILTPPNRLARRATRIVGVNVPDEPDPVRRAENALDLLSNEFDAWMSTEIDALESARAATRGAAGVADLAGLFRVSHDIRGQAATLGFPLAGEIAEGLCDLISRPRLPSQALIDIHVDSIRAMVREDVRDRDDPVGAALVQRLSELRLDPDAPRN